MAKYQQKMIEYYNKKVKLRRLNIGDIVLRRIAPTTKDSTQGKLGSNIKRALQGRPILETRKLPPRIDGREKIAMSMEHQAFENV